MASENWHLDKRVPLALILTIAIQTGAALWFMATLSAQVGVNSVAIARLDVRTSTVEIIGQAQAVQLGRIEEQISGVRSDLSRLLNAIERQRPNPQRRR